MASAESNIMRRIMLALSAKGCLVFRNNVGQAWQGKATVAHKTMTVTLQPGDVVIRQATPVKYGVCNPGGSDLIGVAPGGRLIAVESKTDTGRVSKEQQQFIDAVNRAGGIAFVARSAEEALALLEG